MMTEMIILATKTGNFGYDIIFPAVAGAIVFALIINSVLKHFGYALW